jgi:hypothetical protein
VDRLLPGLAALTLALGLSGCGAAGRASAGGLATAAPPGQPDLSAAAARQVLTRFAQALEAGRWPEAWSLLSPRWRVATTPERLAADWRGAGPVARESAARVVALLQAGAALDGAPGEGGGPLRLAVGAGRAARVVAEAGGWRIDSLE